MGGCEVEVEVEVEVGPVLLPPVLVVGCLTKGSRHTGNE